MADVLIGTANGAARADFSGSLSFSWPKDATGTPLNHGADGYDPQFAYGYGLSYARTAEVPALSEASGVAAVASSVDRYFVDGQLVSPWSLALEDEGGQSRSDLTARAASPRGGLVAETVDDLAQESGLRLTFQPDHVSSGLIWGQAVDLTRQSNGELALAFRFRVDAAPQGQVRLAVGQGAVDATSIFSAAPLGEWRTLKVRLSCFAAAGSDVAVVDQPFRLSSNDAFTVSVSEVRLVSNENDTVCPSAAPLFQAAAQ